MALVRSCLFYSTRQFLPCNQDVYTVHILYLGANSPSFCFLFVPSILYFFLHPLPLKLNFFYDFILCNRF